MTFKDYLARRQVNDNPQGDFTEDAQTDRRLPDCTTWSQLHCYLLHRGKSHAVEAARLVWAGYQAKLRREKKRRMVLADTLP